MAGLGTDVLQPSTCRPAEPDIDVPVIELFLKSGR